jgi:hypothetical protein
MNKRLNIIPLIRVTSIFLLLLLTLSAYLSPVMAQAHAQPIALFQKPDNQPAQNSATVQADPYMSKFFRVRDYVNLNVFTPNGSIEVIENASLQGVQVDLFVKREFSFWGGARSLDNYRIIIQQKNNEVIASVENKHTGSRSRSGDNNEFSFVIQVPERGQMNLRTIHGPINVSGFSGQIYIQNHIGNITAEDLDGEIRMASTTGNFDLVNLRGSIYAKSVSGSIHSSNLEGEIRMRSESGNLTVQEASGSMVAASVSGNITCTFESVAQGVSLETINGNIDLTLPVDLGYSIEASGMSYDFSSIQSEVSQQRTGVRTSFLQVRDGHVPIKLSSISGRIKVTESE